MQSAEELRLVLFLSLAATIFILAAGVVVRWMLHKLGRRSVTLSRVRIWLDRGIVVLALGGLTCAAYGYFIEPYWPSVTHVQIKTSKLAAGTRRIRLVHISDLACC
ncbi:MAG TPA: hypothetical protein VJH03_24015 [Blastocatellia bacterium]|nr:hypothetical protein [Blastocatellia bacterium]